MDNHSLRTAGLVDMIVSVREWLGGKSDSISKRIIGFAGDIQKWVKGFAIRMGMVKTETSAIKGILAQAVQDIDAAFKAVPVRVATAEDQNEALLRKMLAEEKMGADEADEEGCGKMGEGDESDADGCGKKAEYHGFNLFE
jgi:hypothetical protein